jgi:large subunit ribosomal protein L6
VSRIGKLPINIPENTEVKFENNVFSCKGSKGELTRKIHPEMDVKIEDGAISVKRPSDSKQHRALHGLTRSLIANMVQGVSQGFEKKLQIQGVGYRAEMKGANLNLTVGYSHPILINFPDDIKASCPSPNDIVIQGIDKELVGQVAAKIRSYKKPEPYKGKGIRYAGEYVRRKAGKTGV